jgi:hypothetical protein
VRGVGVAVGIGVAVGGVEEGRVALGLGEIVWYGVKNPLRVRVGVAVAGVVIVWQPAANQTAKAANMRISFRFAFIAGIIPVSAGLSLPQACAKLKG